MANPNNPSPCPSCSWTPQKQHRCYYTSSIKSFYGASARGVWFIGTDIVLKERPADPPTYEVANKQFLQAHTSIPTPGIAKDWDLQAAWPTLSQIAKVRIAGQMANHLEQLRKLQAGKMASIGEAPLYSGWLFLQGAGTPHGSFTLEDELWQSLVGKLEKLPEKARDAFRKRLPPCAPYTFTHGDLTTVNFMVKDGNLAAIIDWEWAGYFPIWWEYTAAGIELGKEDAEWKELLASRIPPSEDGRAFWKGFYRLSRYPDLGDDGKELVEELLRE
ncbi:hypothetical protein K458DRAFT_461325 [Lentithecium fluviatile CBS 122367]|uniref:Aminoglycoside phosphotransferase domain-containing protein n=1 Tax=Lentithecium fluviatile CBS 122367 TaxID=1168545 RepID=A0A6G1IMV9_9PLEO|nr:hypothetical protein K458DRAFT_461325 [Lentithecium fluviatile CBS 122367]